MIKLTGELVMKMLRAKHQEHRGHLGSPFEPLYELVNDNVSTVRQPDPGWDAVAEVIADLFNQLAGFTTDVDALVESADAELLERASQYLAVIALRKMAAPK